MNQLGKAMLRVALVALGLLMVPLVASQMVDGWNWDAGTFVIVYVLFFGTGMAYADIAKNGSDFLTDKGIISDFVAHKKFVIKFASASGDQITDEYLTDGLSVKSLRADCPALFKKRQNSLDTVLPMFFNKELGLSSWPRSFDVVGDDFSTWH